MVAVVYVIIATTVVAVVAYIVVVNFHVGVVDVLYFTAIEIVGFAAITPRSRCFSQQTVQYGLTIAGTSLKNNIIILRLQQDLYQRFQMYVVPSNESPPQTIESGPVLDAGIFFAQLSRKTYCRSFL